MELSRLEIKGFKSFGDKAIINFDKGITGIVGPNGCGKSNIVDAIRWVLGEQKTKMLRSDKLENIIFNGTKKRKPTQLAEVSLTFNNTKNILPTEYSSVTIARRYYRSGESEYELNGVPCRLKDITNLFLDTGIASNSYAIIELKMVDDILNNKDNSRRGLFEEAAGISKFKKRKKETLRKLAGTDDDLDRVEDLLFEIEKNLKSLEKQARQAERYYKLKEEYKNTSIILARTTVSKHRHVFNKLTRQIEEENDKKVELNKSVSLKESEIQELKKNLLNKEKALSVVQKSLNDHVNQIRQYESDKQIKNERLRFLTDKSDSLNEQIEQDKKSNDRAAFSLQGLNNELEIARKQLSESKDKLLELQESKQEQEARLNGVRKEHEALTSLHGNLNEEVFQIKKTLEINEIQIGALKQQLEKAASDSSEQTASVVEFEKKLAALGKQIKEKRSALDAEVAYEEKLNGQINDKHATIDIVKDELNEVNRKIDARTNEYNLTKSLVDNLEGFPEAIRFLKKQNWNKKAPLLSDLITCNDDYRVAIENYLEPLLNYYVVNTEADAFKAINLLSDASKGKANFFVLDAFDKYKPTPSKLYEHASPASEIMEYEEKYKQLIAYILDRVYLVDGDEKLIPQDAESIFITKSGKVTRRKFSISGGSVGLFEGKRIGRAKNLEKLEKTIKQLTGKRDKVEETLKNTQEELILLEKDSHQQKIDELAVELGQLKEENISVLTKQEQFSQMISQADTTKEDLLGQIKQLEESSKQLPDRLARQEKELVMITEKLAKTKQELQLQEGLYTDQSSAFNNENINYHQQENKVRSLEQEIDFKQAAFETSKERIDHNKLNLQENEKEIKNLIETAEVADEKLIGMYEEKDKLEKRVNEAEKLYYSARGNIDEQEQDQRKLQHQRESIDGLLFELHNRLNETRLELSSIKERLSIEFEIDIDDIQADTGKEEDNRDAAEVQEAVLKIKEKMERIGPINPMALEAFDEIKERHQFISAQKDDLIKAKESLLTTIDEIDLVARTTFLDAFHQIEVNFIKVFRSLFTEEDDCDLVLLDPENPLESEIDIIAKPKGKKPLSINQLSGGEKTLTATSLLFAIYLLKPAPFCIFDEVDAPLDDANIDKFNNIIKKFSTESQFIIVTHNKRTMVSTDVIYGITMVEQGVSKVVSVDLRELA
jgi:chromosome segregation protein